MEESPLTMLMDMKAIQNRISAFAQSYQRSVLNGTQSSAHKQMQKEQIVNRVSLKEIEKQEDNKNKKQQQIILARNMDLSCIFREIELGQQIGTKGQGIINFQLQIDGRIHKLKVRQQQEFRLSNFNSFNVKESEQECNQTDFAQLVQNIQKSIGKTLKKQAIQKILQQMQVHLSTLQIEKRSQQQRILVDKTLTKISNSNITMTLNKQQQLDSSLNQLKKQSKRNKNHKYQSILNRSVFDRTKARKIDHVAANDKENGLVEQTKQLKIKKSSGVMIMQYKSSKSVDNFCIKNKIYGKQREKILKAVNNSKNIVDIQ